MQSVSPDGNRLLFTQGAGIYMINADGSGMRKLLDDAVGGRWSRDGSQLLFSKTASNGTYFLATLDRSGAVHQLTISKPYAPSGTAPPWPQIDAFPQWAPDGSMIVFASNRDHLNDHDSPLELFIVNPDGTGLRKITSKPQDGPRVDEPAW